MDFVTPAMLPLPVPHVDLTQTKEDHWVMDPLDEETLVRWNKTAATNTLAFRNVFHCVPDDTCKYLIKIENRQVTKYLLVTNWDEYHAFYPDPSKINLGHVYDPNMSVQEIRENLDKIHGHLVEFPTQFLRFEDLQGSSLPIVGTAVQELYT